MSKTQKIRQTPQSIDTIIHSFEHYALGDINHNRCKPIAAYILSICFIEQLSGFIYAYEIANDKRAEQFFTDYMSDYKDINLYHLSRHTLVHNYSSKGIFDIDNIGFDDNPHQKINGVIHINTNVFIECLEAAFIKAKKDLLITGSPQNINALEYSMYFPVLVDTRDK